MTEQSEPTDDPNYIHILDHGHVYLIDHMGDDAAIVQAARVSYGAGTRKVSEDRALIRYLMRHQHSSPIEMVEFKFRIKIPIVVMRQLIRHRTASVNEYSGRYSVMSNEFYLPDPANIKPQSADNKQGRAGEIDEVSKAGVRWIMQAAHEHAYAAYTMLLGERDGAEDHYDPYSADDPLLTNEFPGIARESARCVLPVANYTECYWKIDLSNLFKFLKLRRDIHAQYEMRVLADAIYVLIQPIVPLACEAYEDYMQDAVTLSRMELALLRAHFDIKELEMAIRQIGEDASSYGAKFGLTKREMNDFLSRFA